MLLFKDKKLFLAAPRPEKREYLPTSRFYIEICFNFQVIFKKSISCSLSGVDFKWLYIQRLELIANCQCKIWGPLPVGHTESEVLISLLSLSLRVAITYKKSFYGIFPNSTDKGICFPLAQVYFTVSGVPHYFVLFFFLI